ncbi:MAG: HDIG domain-containing metalloprotein [Mycoplasmoidaceae bacterium]
MKNELSSSNLILLIVCIILLVIIIGCAAVITYKRIRRIKHNQSNNEIEDYRYNPLNKEIRRYKKLREEYKQKLIDQDFLDHDKRLQDMQTILDAELEEYKNEQLLKINQDLEKNKNELLKETLLNVMQPLHLKVINESSVHFLPIEEKYKPLLIGKKGQNIKKLNELTNCNISIERENKYIEISSPNPLEKQVAINTINHLIKSEAFDVKAIENVYAKEHKLINQECIETGKKYLGILNIGIKNPKIFEYVGRLKYRWSFNQNVLQHCYEVALICEQLASKLGLDPQTAKEVGFFHDIGKCIDYECRYDHVDTGIKIAKECQLSDEVFNGILKHHRTNCNEDYVLLTRCADAWSAARTGARHTPSKNDEQTTKIVENKIQKIRGIISFKVSVENKEIKVIFIPVIADKKHYQAIKFNIIKTIKQDVRLNKYHVLIQD